MTWGVFEAEDGTHVIPAEDKKPVLPHIADVFCICDPIIDETGIVIHKEEQ